jgi:hypothetical protein
MLILTTVLIVGLVSTTVLLINQRTDHAQLTAPRASLRTVGIQIICGNCSGDGERPLRTYLDEFGYCAQCGGHSYVLATNLYAHSVRLHSAAEYEKPSASGRLLPFNTGRPEKIAV